MLDKLKRLFFGPLDLEFYRKLLCYLCCILVTSDMARQSFFMVLDGLLRCMQCYDSEHSVIFV